MKRLWKMVPPCLSDVLGFQEVLSHTDGLGVVDDASNYKPLNRGKGGKPGGFDGRREGGWQGQRGGENGGWHSGNWGEKPGMQRDEVAGGGFDGRREGGWHGQRGEGGFDGRREGGWHGQHGEGGEGSWHGQHGEGGWHGQRGEGGFSGRKGRRGFGGSSIRVVSSEIQEADIVTGTEAKVMEAFERGNEQFQPKFALLTVAPCASMINTDLNEVAEKIQAEYGVPAGAVALDGQKDYLYGVSLTLEALGKLLLEKAETIPGTVNLLGCNSIDWPESAVQETESWLTNAGFKVLTKWGAQETAENLKRAAAASVNLVVNISGLRLARYMEQEFQIPYVVGAPFGTKQCERLLEQLKNGRADADAQALEENPEALVIGEQLQADAIRAALLEKGWKNVHVCGFFEMDKQIMRPGDRKLVSEDELSETLESGSLKAVFGSKDCQFAAGRSLPWVSLPSPGTQGSAETTTPFSMVGEALDRWLDGALKQIDIH